MFTKHSWTGDSKYIDQTVPNKTYTKGLSWKINCPVAWIALKLGRSHSQWMSFVRRKFTKWANQRKYRLKFERNDKRKSTWSCNFLRIKVRILASVGGFTRTWKWFLKGTYILSKCRRIWRTISTVRRRACWYRNGRNRRACSGDSSVRVRRTPVTRRHLAWFRWFCNHWWTKMRSFMWHPLEWHLIFFCY